MSHGPRREWLSQQDVCSKATLKWLPSEIMAIKLDLVCFKLSFSNSRRSQPLFAALWIFQVTVMKWLLMPWVSLRTSYCEVGWHSYNKYYCLNALFWPIFDGIVNHKHHDFDVNKSERDDYGHYWTISESDLDLKTSAAREWASRACLLVGGPLLTLWPTFELREKYSNPPSFGRELNLL